MVDALTGNLLWHAGPASGFGYDSTAALKLTKMNNSIPAEVRVLDLTNDGFADRMYVTDTGARIWRFDIFNGQPKASLVTGGVIASLGMADGGGTSPQDARRFYNAPDVALLKANGVSFLNIAVGTGYRGHPLNLEIRDRFYSVRDYTVFAPKTQAQHNSFTPITDSALVDLTTNVNPTLSASVSGWKIEFSQPSWHGEKVLAEARTFAGAILFPTFTPTSSNVNTCTSGGGKNMLYAVSAIDAKPIFDRDKNATLDALDRVGGLDQSGIASEVTILFPSPDDPVNCKGAQCSPPPVCKVGVESCGVTFSNDPVKTFWWQRDVD
jgi:type IV pilus assembly protein PilY1